MVISRTRNLITIIFKEVDGLISLISKVIYLTGKPINSPKNSLKNVGIAIAKKLIHETVMKSVSFNTMTLINKKFQNHKKLLGMGLSMTTFPQWELCVEQKR